MESTALEREGTKRRSRTKQERRAIVEETLAAGVPVKEVAQAHGVRPNQVFHWRRLYREGLLGNEAATSTLVPVRIADPPTEPRRAPVKGATRDHRAAARSVSGTIQVELEKARIYICGAADPASLRAVLESLLR